MSLPGLARNEAKKTFFDFLNFFTIFLLMILPRSCRNDTGNENFFFLSFLIYPGLDCLEMKLEWLFFFFNFLRFFTIFLGMLQPGSCRNSTGIEKKIFLFFSLS